MNTQQWHKISELFEAALDRPLDQRATFLAHACSGDTERQQRVEAMLAVDAQEDLLMDRPVYEAVDTVMPSVLSLEYSLGMTGDLIGDYRLIRELGRGGMGTVYLAYDTRLGRQAALKLLPSRFNSPERVRRLQREARSASALNHPHIITIYDFGQENDRYFIASEFVEGRNLRHHIDSSHLTLNQIVEIAIQVASALETAHAAGIIHRDIKPENIMLRPDGYAKVVDFGLAKLTDTDSASGETKANHSKLTSAFETKTGVLLGTVNYMSPEQVRGQKLDGRSDLFSLGVVLYELVTGHRPFRGETWHHTMVAITDSEPPPIAGDVQNTPAALHEIINRVLAKNRDQRYQTARALLSDLETLQHELGANVPIERIGREPSAADRISYQPSTLIAGNVSVIARRGRRERAANAIKLVAHLNRRRLTATMASIILVAAAAYFYFGRGFGPRQPALTNKDAILLADFVNATGDPDFDGTLKQGLTVQLGQSPYINIFPEEHARETLGLMERSRDEKITRELGREICQRRAIKVLMVPTIARLGRNYVITLEAVNCQSDEEVANQQTEAESKEQVLKALGRAATEMREKLGESLASIRRFDVPIEQATTPSFEAFKEFSRGVDFRRKGQHAQAVTHFKRAIELDNNFALALLQLGTSYRDLRSLALGNQYLERAYQLRDRVSEHERLEISATYYRHITGELDKRLEATLLLTQTYPQDSYGYHLHGNSLMVAGEFEQAAEAYRKALLLDPDYSLSRANLALALMGLNRFDEAHEVIQQGVARGLDSSGFHNRLFLIAFLQRDYQLMERQVEWSTGRPEEYQIREFQARSFAFAGRRREASKVLEQAAALAQARGLPAEKARILFNEANLNASFGMTQLAEKQAGILMTQLEKQGISAEEVQPSLIGQLDSQPLAWVLAFCGNASRAQSVDDDFTRKHPLDTVHNSIWQPLVRTTLELKFGESRHGHVATNHATRLLPPSRQYEPALNFRPNWVRGQAYLQAKDGALAAAEFQRIIEHRGWDVLSPLWPMAHLGLARAAVLQGDMVRARKAYEDFFLLWNEADADLPVLIEARREYEKLKRI